MESVVAFTWIGWKASSGISGKFGLEYATKGCPSKGKSIRAGALQGDFEALLDKAQPTRKLFDLARAMFEELWNRRLAKAESAQQHIRDDLAKIEQQIEQLVDRTVETDNKTMMAAYEKRIARLEADRVALSERLGKERKPAHTFEETFRTAMAFLANPRKLWDSPYLEDKRAVLRLTFADKLAYCRKEGFRTIGFSLPFRLLEDFWAANSEMVGGAGIEPATPAV